MTNHQIAYFNCLLKLYQLKKYLNNLLSVCSPSYDSISSEYIKYVLNTDTFGNNMLVMLNLSINYGTVPDAFYKGVLVPDLKKSNESSHNTQQL